MKLEEFLKNTREYRFKQIEQSHEIVVTEEAQLPPTLVPAGKKVESIGREQEMAIPGRSKAVIFEIPTTAEKVSFLKGTAQILNKVPAEPVSVVLGNIVKNNKGVTPRVYEEGEEGWEANLMADQARILDLALQFGVRPFVDENGQVEQGAFEIPDRAIVFVEGFHKVEEVPSQDRMLPTGEDNPFGSNWAIESPARVSEIALSETDGTEWVREDKPETAIIDEEDEATKSASLDVRRQEIQNMMFPNIPGTVTRITAFLQTEPVAQIKAAPPASQPAFSGDTQQGGAPALPGMDDQYGEMGRFVSKKVPDGSISYTADFNSEIKDPVS